MNDGGGLVIGLDLDGVCADYIGATRPIVADMLGVDPAELGEKRDWGFTDWGLDRDGFLRMHREAVMVRRVFRHANEVAGAVEGVRRLAAEGDTIRVITNRLGDGSAGGLVVSDTMHWLVEHELPYDEVCFVADKTTVYADVYIDDAPHVLHGVAAAGRPAIVFDHPYNRDAPGIRACGWSEVLEAVTALRCARRAA